MAENERGTINRRAADYVDHQHQVQRDALIADHQQHEKRENTRRAIEIKAFERQRDQTDRHHANRLNTIENKRAAIEQRMDQRHNTMGGKLQRLMPGGKARQEAEKERLQQRAAQLRNRAERNYQGQTERRMQAEQKARIQHQQHMKDTQTQHNRYREEQAQRHQQSRDRKIEERAQTLRQATEQQLRQALQQEQQRQTRARA